MQLLEDFKPDDRDECPAGWQWKTAWSINHRDSVEPEGKEHQGADQN